MKWEHGWLREAKHDAIWFGPGPGPSRGLGIQEAIAELGASGWELVSVVIDDWYYDGSKVAARDHYFKRAIPD